MAQSRPARKVQLSELREKFGLCRSDEASFFREWETALPSLTAAEQERLDQVRAHYLYLLEYPVLESIVKMVVLSPVLELAGFYNPPFRVSGEVGVQVTATDGDEVIQGSIDVLVVQQQLWVTVIEAKNSELSLTKALPQTLAYLLAGAEQQKPVFGAILNGTEFLFLKLVAGAEPRYGLSNTFSLLNQGNDLYQVVRILKRLCHE